MNWYLCSNIAKVLILLFFLGESCGKSLKKRDNHDCAIPINGGFAEPQPLVLCPNKGRGEFVYPIKPGSGQFVATRGESFRIACPGSRLQLNTIDFYNDTLITCLASNYFRLDDADIQTRFDKISCEKYPKHVARRTNKICGNGVSIEIGFPLQGRSDTTNQRPEEFHRVIDLCHDETMSNTIYAHARILSVIDSAQTSFPRTAFRKGKFFKGIQIQTVYSRNSQRETLAWLLNSGELASKYIPETGPYYFARGHLIAKADFVYGSQQRTTFYYINVLPMWQTVNAGNWATMEANIRTYATKRDLDLDVWVGGYGILTLKDVDGREQEIYLDVDENNTGAVPVPKILFKVVYNYETGAGIVFLSANNPYLKKLTNEYRICKDICHKIKYMTWRPNKITQGLSYCCEIDDFRQAFPNIPCFETRRLLL